MQKTLDRIIGEQHFAAILHTLFTIRDIIDVLNKLNKNLYV